MPPATSDTECTLDIRRDHATNAASKVAAKTGAKPGVARSARGQGDAPSEQQDGSRCTMATETGEVEHGRRDAPIP